MEKQKVFIPVDVKDELPEMDKKVIVFGEQLSSNPQMGGKYPFVTKRQDLSKSSMRPDRLQDENKFMYARYVSDWLKEREGYFFTAEELKNIIGNAYAECFTNHGEECSEDEYYSLKNEYIESLNII
jgi:hypothetical protein